MAADIVDSLLDEIKRYINVTWDDYDTEEKIKSIAHNAIFYITSKLGAVPDFSENGFPRILLMEYCRYAWNEAIDAFETNYMSLILSMQFERQVGTDEETA